MSEIATEKVFKNHINWRIYNYILDTCIELEDNEIPFIVSVNVYDGDDYYTVYDNNGGFLSFYEKDLNKMMEHWSKNGFSYSIILSSIFDGYDRIIERISINKNIELMSTKSNNGIRIFRFRDKV